MAECKALEKKNQRWIFWWAHKFFQQDKLLSDVNEIIGSFAPFVSGIPYILRESTNQILQDNDATKTLIFGKRPSIFQ